MPIVNGVYTALTFEEALAEVIDNAPASLVFAPGNPPELMIANMIAGANVRCDTAIGETLAALMSPVGAMIDLQNPNDPRKDAIATVGTVSITNTAVTAQSITAGTIFTSSTGQTYALGNSAVSIPAGETAYASVTCSETGISGNIPAGLSFTASGYSNLTIVNPSAWTNGADAETDAVYLQRTIVEKTGYGSQVTSVAAETALKAIYPAARIYVNRSVDALLVPVPVPANGYNCVVLTPNGIYENAAIMADIFTILSERFEFVNAQTAGDARHKVFSGTAYVSDMPQAYYYTAAQNVETTIDATINVRFAPGTDAAERVSQAVDFATFFIRRLMNFLSGVQGTTTIKFVDEEYAETNTDVIIAADAGYADPIAPSFGVASIRDLVSDASTRLSTPQLMYDSTSALSIVMNPGVSGESAITMTLSSSRQFIDFKNDALFSDNTSWFDRFISLNPADINITVTDVSA